MLKIAFKEWAAVCRALADGTQTVILRKGGIAEVGGEFKPEHSRFWLYPTHYHEQHRHGLKPEAMHFLDAAERSYPATGTIDFTKIRGFISAADHQRYSEKYRPRIGDVYDVYMVKSGATTGVTAIVETDIEFNIWSPLAAIRCGDRFCHE